MTRAEPLTPARLAEETGIKCLNAGPWYFAARQVLGDVGAVHGWAFVKMPETPGPGAKLPDGEVASVAQRKTMLQELKKCSQFRADIGRQVEFEDVAGDPVLSLDLVEIDIIFIRSLWRSGRTSYYPYGYLVGSDTTRSPEFGHILCEIRQHLFAGLGEDSLRARREEFSQAAGERAPQKKKGENAPLAERQAYAARKQAALGRITALLNAAL